MENTVIRYILNWTEKNIYTKAGIAELINDVGYSRSTVDLWFRRTCEMTLGEYVMRRRMSRAAILLRMSVLSVTEIAALFHYHSSQNFSRAFRNISGMTPTQYRNQPEWQFALLQQPLLMGGTEFENLGECVLPELTVCGEMIFFQDSFLWSGQEVNRCIKNAVISNQHHGGDICLACRFIPVESQDAGRQAVLNVEMLVQAGERKNTDKNMILSAGKYAQFSFSGSWDEYVVFSWRVYFSLAREGKVRRDGYDLLYFSSPVNSPEEVHCRYLIPVTDNEL